MDLFAARLARQVETCDPSDLSRRSEITYQAQSERRVAMPTSIEVFVRSPPQRLLRQPNYYGSAARDELRERCPMDVDTECQMFAWTVREFGPGLVSAYRCCA